jgi:hypothetical protein
MGGKVFKVYGAQGIALRLDPKAGESIFPDGCDGVQVHCSGQDPAPLMVRVVAADLRAARCRKEIFRFLTKNPLKALLQGEKPLGLRCQGMSIHMNSSMVFFRTIIAYTIHCFSGKGKW